MTHLARRRYLTVLAAAAAGLALSLLSTLPAGAHGLASAGLAAGASHPLLGLDHLLLLLGVGGAAASFVAGGVLSSVLSFPQRKLSSTPLTS